MKCKCGCGQEAREGKEYIDHHYLNIVHRSNIGRSPWNKGLTKKTSNSMMISSIKHIGQVSWCKGKTKEDDERLLNAGVKISENIQTKGSHAGSNNPMHGKHHTIRHKEQIAKSAYNRWQDSEYVKKQMQTRGVTPNKTELYLANLFQPFGFKFVGDGQLIIGGKCPDYCNDGQKLIELFGDYWHKGEDPQIKINHFKQFGYDCLVIWEHELKDEDILLSKIQEFSIRLK